MTCQDFRERIDAYLDGGPADALDAHARGCPDCAARRADAERLLAALAV
ncbi:MAG: zf-HC2 domain-containing protein, partial [Gemmataceae bacterium]